MSKINLHLFTVLLILLALLTQPLLMPPATAGLVQGNEFVKQDAGQFRLNGKIFRFAGANNYYPMYKSQFMVDDLLTTASESGFRVLRIWGSLEIGNQDGSNSVDGKKEGIYFQYWDGSAPAYNDGADGLERLDYVVYKAGQLGLKLIIPFVNNWNAFGGMDQYVRWAGGQYHDDFYSNPTIRGWFKNWISHLLNRTNVYTGLKYKDDPTIMMWELANEPRCLSAGAYPRSDQCNTQTLISWADEISRFIKFTDNKHLVSVGDEGFYCIPGAVDWTENCGEGVDTLAFARLPKIDAMSFHLYPDHWLKDAAWGTEWIARHIADAQSLHKPAYLGEFGWQDKATRNPVFKEWTNTIMANSGNGALYWILSGKQDDGSYYPDYDGFTVYCPSPVCTTFQNFAQMLHNGKMMVFPPVADNDILITEFETPITFSPLINDITYDNAILLPETMDLDPLTPGQQTAISVYGGDFTWLPGGEVLFTPSSGFSGKVNISYTVQDSLGQTSNAAELQVTVKPNPAGTVVLYSFETGTEGWGPANWEIGKGTVSQSPEFASDGSYSLRLDVNAGGWFGVEGLSGINLSDKTQLKYELKTTASGTSLALAIHDKNWQWCQSSWGWQNPNTTNTLTFDLTSLSCANPDFSEIHSIYMYISPGILYIDFVRVE